MKTGLSILAGFGRIAIFCFPPMIVMGALAVGPAVAALEASEHSTVAIQTLVVVAAVVWISTVVAISCGIAEDHEEQVADYLDRHVWRDGA